MQAHAQGNMRLFIATLLIVATIWTIQMCNTKIINEWMMGYSQSGTLYSIETAELELYNTTCIKVENDVVENN